MRKSALQVVILLFGFATYAFADSAGDWRRDQAAIKTQLEQRNYAGARKASIRLANRMFDRLGIGAEASQLLAETVSLRASAEEGLGNADDATWYREVAAALDPRLPRLPRELDGQPIILTTVPTPSDIKPPEPGRRRMPERPAIVDSLGDAEVALKVVIDTDGRVRHPTIVLSPAPSLSYASLEAMRQWRFRPGTVAGKPLPVSYNMTFRFH